MCDVWTCCQCGASNLVANSPERCPDCSHYKCDSCPYGRPGLAQKLAFSLTMPVDISVLGHLHTASFTPANIHFFEGASTNSDRLAYAGGYNNISQHTYPTSDSATTAFPEAGPVSGEPHTRDHGNDDGGQHYYS